jgi:hypothetical protein
VDYGTNRRGVGLVGFGSDTAAVRVASAEQKRYNVIQNPQTTVQHAGCCLTNKSASLFSLMTFMRSRISANDGRACSQNPTLPLGSVKTADGAHVGLVHSTRGAVRVHEDATSHAVAHEL